MKKLLKFTLLVAIASLLALGVWIYRPVVSDPGRDAVDFPAFPIDQPIHIDFANYPGETGTESAIQFREASYWNGYSRESTGRREQMDQWLDWLLMTVLSSSNLQPKEINASLKDLPPSRRSVLQAVGNFEFGPTRSRAVRDGQVIAIIPTGSPDEEQEHLAYVADEQRKNIVQLPSCLYIFEYTVDPDREIATVVRRKTVDGANLFSNSDGYHEQALKKLDDIKQLMSQIDDVTYARLEGSILRVGGRRVPNYRGVGVEEIATIWQSEKSGLEGLRGSGFSLDPSFDPIMVKRNVEPLLSILSGLYRVNGITDDTFGAGDSTLTSEFSRAQREHRSPNYSAILKQLTGEKSQASFTTDRGAIRSKLEEGDFDTYLHAGMYACSRDQQRSECRELLTSVASLLQIQKARYDGTLKGTEVGMTLFYTDLLMKLWSFDFQGSTPRAGQVVDFPNELSMSVSRSYASELEKFPATRLWLGSLDKGFQIGPNRKELVLARTTTRVFAVPLDFLENKDVTGVTEPHVYDRTFITWWNQHYEEVARYEREYQRLNEIMKWSQIVAWLNSSDQGDVLGFLGSLSNCADGQQKECIKRDDWFPTWLKQHDPELTYHCWPFSPTSSTCPRSAENEVHDLTATDVHLSAFGVNTTLHVKKEKPEALHFYPKNYAGIEVEVLPLLRSAEFQVFGGELVPAYRLAASSQGRDVLNLLHRLGLGAFWSGGVSLAERGSISARSALTEDTPTGVRSGNLNFAESDAATGRFKTLDKVEIQLSDTPEGVVGATLRPDSSARLRALIGEFRNSSFETKLAREPGNVVFSVKNAETALGDLRIRSTSDGFHVGWISRDVDAAQMLARKVSQSRSPEVLLSSDSSVSMYIQTANHTYLVKPTYSDHWVKMQVGTSNDSTVPAGFDARIAGFEAESKSVDLALLDNRQIGSQIPSSGFVDIEGNKVVRIVSELPQNVRTKTVSYLGRNISLQVQEDGHVFAALNDLPEDLRISPEKLKRVVGGYRAGSNELAIEKAEFADFRSLAEEIVLDPKSVRQALDKKLGQALREYDQVALKNPAEARQRIAQMNLEFGDLPDISLRRALSDLEKGDAESAAKRLREIEGLPVGDNQQFFDEINRRIALSAGTDAGNLQQFAGYADWQLKTHQAGTPALLAKGQGNNFYTELHISKLKAEPANAEMWSETTPKIFYIQDSPGLNNLDPYSPSGQLALESLVGSGKVSIERAAATELAHYRPGVVVEVDSGRNLRLAGLHDSYSRPVPMPRNQGCGAEDKSGDCPSVYVIEVPRSRS